MRHHVHPQEPKYFLDFGPMASIVTVWVEPSHHGTDALSKRSTVVLAEVVTQTAEHDPL